MSHMAWVTTSPRDALGTGMLANRSEHQSSGAEGLTGAHGGSTGVNRSVRGLTEAHKGVLVSRGLTGAHRGLQGATGLHRGQQERAGAHRGSQGHAGLTGTHRGPRGLMEVQGGLQGVTRPHRGQQERAGGSQRLTGACGDSQGLKCLAQSRI